MRGLEQRAVRVCAVLLAGESLALDMQQAWDLHLLMDYRQ